VFSLSLPEARYPSPESVSAFHRSVLERVRALPGVASAGATHALPFSGMDSVRGFVRDGEPRDSQNPPNAEYRLVTPGYFAAMGIPVKQGREFTDADTAGAPGAIIVNESFARQYLVGEPLGQRIRQAGSAGDLGCHAQSASPGADVRRARARRSGGAPAVDSGAGVRARSEPAGRLTAADERADFAVRRRRAVQYRTARHVRDRRLDARRRRRVRRDVVHRGRRPARDGNPPGARRASGSAIGLAAAWVLGQSLQLQLFMTSVHDPLTFAATASVLLGKVPRGQGAKGPGCQGLGTLALWHCGTVAPWHLGTLAPWHLGTLHSGQPGGTGVFFGLNVNPRRRLRP
jgi:hypothetical protein